MHVTKILTVLLLFHTFQTELWKFRSKQSHKSSPLAIPISQLWLMMGADDDAASAVAGNDGEKKKS